MRTSFSIIAFLVAVSLSRAADVYWVSPTGSATWAAAESDTPLSGTACASITTANANAVAGDTINIRGGTYSGSAGGPAPDNSGTSENKIVYQAYSGETPTFTNPGGTGLVFGIFLDQDYIIIDGITIDDIDRPIAILGGSYNEIRNVTCQNNTFLSVALWDNNIGGDGPFSTNNWFHDCTFKYHGSATDGNDEGGTMQIGIPGYDYDSNNNVVEDCYFEGGSHHHIEVYSEQNVIRNNVFTNDGYFENTGTAAPQVGTVDADGLYGNRSVAFAISDSAEKRNLMEGNRLGWSGPPPDDNGANALVFSNQYNIGRYNYTFMADGNGIYMKDGSSSSNNFIYNNTVWENGDQTDGRRTDMRTYGIAIHPSSIGSYFINNLTYGNDGGAFERTGGGGDWADHTFATNWTGTAPATGNDNWPEDSTDPLFNDTTTSDKTSLTQPVLDLLSNSPAIDAGSSLTLANGSGSSSTALVVDESGFFQDGSIGSSLSDIQADWIAIGSVSNIVQISSINYSTDTITLASAMTWSDNDDIWLYSKSDGERVLYGSAPDQGAFEYQAAAAGSAYTGQLRLNSGGAKPSLGGGARFKLN